MSEPYYSDEHVTLWHGDALAALAQLPDASVDAVITDPPYSSGGMVRSDRAGQSAVSKYVSSQNTRKAELVGFSGDNRDQRSYAYWCALWLGECLRVTKPGGVLIVFTDWRQLPATTDAIQAGGWVWRGIVPWVKINARPQSGRFTNQCEYALWASHGSMPQDWSAPTLPGFLEALPPRDRQHITQKPLGVMRSLVQIVPRGGVILDPFVGSGTTGVASLIEGHTFIGGDREVHHLETTVRRIRESQALTVAGAPEASLLDFGEDAS